MLYGILIFAVCIFLIVKFGDREMDRAIAYSRKEHEKYPELYRVQFKLERSIKELFSKKDNIGVIEHANYLLLLNPKNYIALTCRATSLSNIDYYINAIDDYKHALAIRREANIIGLLGNTYYKIGNLYDAKNYLSQAVQLGAAHYKPLLEILNTSPKEVLDALREKGFKRDCEPWEEDIFSSFFVEPLFRTDQWFGGPLNEYEPALEQHLEKLLLELAKDENNSEILAQIKKTKSVMKLIGEFGNFDENTGKFTEYEYFTPN
jgi:tetratricopeptide (TPR) repeat protein